MTILANMTTPQKAELKAAIDPLGVAAGDFAPSSPANTRVAALEAGVATGVGVKAEGLVGGAAAREKFAPFYARMLAAKARADIRNPRTAGLYSGCTVTVSTTAPSLPIRPAVTNSAADFLPFFTVVGGWTGYSAGSGGAIIPYSVTRNSSATQSNIITGTAGQAYQVFERIVFNSTAQDVYVKISQSENAPVRFIVDGQYVDMAGTTLSATPSQGTINYIRLAFAGRSEFGRRIEIEVQQGTNANIGLTQIYGILQPAIESIWAPSIADMGPRVALICDSIGTGANANINTAGADSFIKSDGWVRQMGDRLGINDVWSMAISGSGFWRRSGSSASFMDAARLSDARECKADMFLFSGSGVNDVLNDGSVETYRLADGTTATKTISASAVGEAVTAQIANIRSVNKFAPIIFTDPVLTTGTTYQTRMPSYAAAIASAVAAVRATGDLFTIYIPSNTVDPKMQFGNGTIAAPNGTGNNDWIKDTDGVHERLPGHVYMGQWRANEVMKALRSIADTLGITTA